MELSAKRALVTGTSRGIGRAITEKLLNANATVIGTAKSSDFPKEFSNNERFEGIYVDLADSNDLNEKLKPLFEDKSAPDVLINNAGIFEDVDLVKSDDETWLDNWDRIQKVNLRAPALISKWALKRWSSTGDGVIINIASRAAYRGDTQEYASYAASKGGLVAFTKSLARDFGQHGIAAYSIAPGFVNTDMAKNSIDVYGKEYLTEGMAFDEITSPEEVAELVAFLATGKVKHMTGTTFHINGGSYMI